MAVTYNKETNKLVIEIECEENFAGELIEQKRLALIDAVSSIDLDRVYPETIYNLTEILKFLEFDHKQNNLVLLGNAKKDPKAVWVKNEIPKAIKDAEKEFVKG